MMEEEKTLHNQESSRWDAAVPARLRAASRPPPSESISLLFQAGESILKILEMHFERSGRRSVRVCLASRPSVPGRNLLGSKRGFFQVLQTNRKATGGWSVEDPKALSNSACPAVLRYGDTFMSIPMDNRPLFFNRMGV